MFDWPALPYEIIGKGTVILLTILFVVIALAILIALFIYLATSILDWVANTVWDISDREADPPPVWKIQVAGVCYALSRLDIGKVSEAYHAAEDVDQDQTNWQAAKSYVNDVYD